MELATIRLIRRDVAIWLVYAGKGRRHFDIFERTGSIFLELPGFNATERVFQSDDLMRRHLAMSDEVRKWVIGARSAPPSRRPADYNPFPYASGTSEAKSFAAELGNIERMFIDAKVGDLVLSPPVGHFEPFLVGEITSKWRKEDDRAIGTFEGEEMPARKVRWLNTALARRDFPARVSRRLQNPLAISKVDESLYEEILRVVYPSFVWRDRSKFNVYGTDYTGTDPLQTYKPALLIKYVLASVFAYEAGEFDQFQSLPAAKAIEDYYNEELVEQFAQSFNSPGRFSVVAGVGSLSILAAAGMLVATSDPSASFTQTQTEVKDQVKRSLRGGGKQEAEDELDDYVDSMRATDWREVQRQLGRPATESMNLTMNNAAEVANHRAELNAR